MSEDASARIQAIRDAVDELHRLVTSIDGEADPEMVDWKKLYSVNALYLLRKLINPPSRGPFKGNESVAWK